MPLLMQLLMGTSIRRYAPPMGTAGLALCLVSGYSLLPAPPPRMTAADGHQRASDRLHTASKGFTQNDSLIGQFELHMHGGRPEDEGTGSRVRADLQCCWILIWPSCSPAVASQ